MLKKKYKVVITDYFKDSIIEKKILGDEAHVICLDQIEENKFTDEIDDADILLVWHAEISDKTIKRLKNNIKISSIHAFLRDTLPLANGLSFVLTTFLSNFLSQISLAIHPAPLTNNPPKIIIPKTNSEGGAAGVNQRDQPAGMRSINLPLGLFHLRS